MLLFAIVVLLCHALTFLTMGHPLSSKTTEQGAWWDGFKGQKHIALLDSSNFDNVLREQDGFIMFFKQRCPGSKAARPEFAALAGQLHELGNPTIIGAVDCSESPTVCAKYPEISSNFWWKWSPTFIYFTREQKTATTYVEGHTTSKFINWISALQKSLGYGKFEDEFIEES